MLKKLFILVKLDIYSVHPSGLGVKRHLAYCGDDKYDAWG